MTRTAGSRNTATLVRADAVFDLIYNAAPDERMYRGDIADALGCTVDQVARCIGIIKDMLAGQYAEPIVFDYFVGYRFADTIEAADEYVVARLRIANIQQQRLRDGTLLPLRAKFPRSRTLRSYEKQLNRVIEDMDDLIEEIVS